MVFTVAPGKSDESLSVTLLPQPAAQVVRIDKDVYANAQVAATFQFVRRNGVIAGLYLIQGGETIPAMRLDVHGKPFAEQLPPAFPPAVSLDDVTLQQYVGTYTGAVATITVTRRRSGLYVQLAGQPAAPVYASAKDAFFYKIVAAQIHFTRDAGENYIPNAQPKRHRYQSRPHVSLVCAATTIHGAELVSVVTRLLDYFVNGGDDRGWIKQLNRMRRIPTTKCAPTVDSLATRSSALSLATHPARCAATDIGPSPSTSPFSESVSTISGRLP